MIQLDAAQAQARFDIVLEVLDAESGEPLAVAELGDRLAAGFLSPTDIYAHREAADGSIVVDVWRVRLLDDPPARR